MSWQTDCTAAGGFATVLPYDAPLSVVFPEAAALIPGADALPGIPGWPACRMGSTSPYDYQPANLTIAEKLALVEDQASDLYYEYIAGPVAEQLENAAQAVEKPFLLLAAAAAVGGFLWLLSRK